MLKLMSIVGARPQFIKAALVTRLLRTSPGIQEVLVHTGQHYDFAMSELFFQELELPPPDRYLGIGSGSHGEQTGRMLIALENTMRELAPDLALVYGDTNSTLAGALAAAKLHIPVAHVEAGLRSFNRRMPEEINRVVSDHLAELLFAPTEIAVKNLLTEGIPRERIHLVGDVMYDACLHFRKRAEGFGALFGRIGVKPHSYILVTIHRAENTDDGGRLENLCRALFLLAAHHPVVFPVHPRTAQRIREFLPGAPPPSLHLLEPVGYLEMMALEAHALLIATDSGGVQKEAYFHRVPCVTLREETEWVELLESGWNVLAPPTLPAEALVRAILSRLGTCGKDLPLYGEGKAAERIVEILQRWGR